MRGAPAVLRSQVAMVIRQVAAEFAEECIQITMNIARNSADDMAKLKAVGMMFDRMAGKATQEVAFDGVESPETILERIRAAREAASGSLNPSLPPPNGVPMSGPVIDVTPEPIPLRPKRRKLSDLDA